ncbi:MAG: hypothetical protein AB1778_01645 [Candidatus Bipolaricaulota bacterium]
MRRGGWSAAWALVVLIGLSASVFSDCGCGTAGEPSCYATFLASESIGMTAVFPIEYFMCYGVTETPMILGWRVETWEGTPVQGVVFDDVAGHWQTFVWDQRGFDGQPVDPGFYRLMVDTTAGAISAAVRIDPCCAPCTACWTCCPCNVCTDRCPTDRCEPYLALNVAAARSCCGLGVEIHITIGGP